MSADHIVSHRHHQSWRLGVLAFVLSAVALLTGSCGGNGGRTTAPELIETTHRFVRLAPTHPGGVSEVTVTESFSLTFEDDDTFSATLAEYQVDESVKEETGRGSWRRDGDVVVATLTESDGQPVDEIDYTLTFDSGFIKDVVGPDGSGAGPDWIFILVSGDRHPSVAELHRRLAAIDYLDFTEPTGENANLYDEATRQAVVTFQEREGLIPLGAVYPETWERLANPTNEAPEAEEDVPSETEAPSPPAPAPAGDNAIYLTFDDGPLSPYTEQVIDLLAQYNARATFFLVGKQVESYQDLVARENSSGHATANHTWFHSSLSGLDRDTFFNEVDSTARAIVAAGAPKPTCLRPPYGATDDRTASMAVELGYRLVLWDVDTQDWSQPGADQIAQHVITSAFPGAVVLMHDAGGNRDQTVAALEVILRELSSQGYTFESVC